MGSTPSIGSDLLNNIRSLFPDEFEEGERGRRELPEGNDRLTTRSLMKKSPERNEETGEYQSGQMGQTVNLLVFTFGGSNPSSPTSSENYS